MDSDDDDLSLNADDVNATEEEIDYYAILNVPRGASAEEIEHAYKQRALIFHPDRHNDDKDKEAAAKMFVLLRKARETLTNPHLKAIYDSVGIGGLEIEGWQVSVRSTNPAHIRKEYEFLKRLRDHEIMLQRVHPTSGLNLRISLVDLFKPNEVNRYPRVELFSLSQAIDYVLPSANRVGLSGLVRNIKGRGSGYMMGTWKKSFAFLKAEMENQIKFEQESVLGTTKLSFPLTARIGLIMKPSLEYKYKKKLSLLWSRGEELEIDIPNDEFVPQLATICSIQLRPTWHGSIALNLGLTNSSVTTSLIHTEVDHPKLAFDFTLTPSMPEFRIVYNKINCQNRSNYKFECTANSLGFIGSMGLGLKLTRFSTIFTKLTLGFPAIFLSARFSIKTGLNSYQFNFTLCEDPDHLARSFILGVLIPYTTIKLIKLVFRRPIGRLMRILSDHSGQDEINELKREEAHKIAQLMRETATRIATEEAQKSGLVIIDAKYGQMANDRPGSELYPLPGEDLIDVTVPLQALVCDSQLRIYSNKEQLPGFFDPCPGQAKMLRVLYRFHDQLHLCTVSEDRPLNIPMRNHRIEQNSQ